MHRSFRLFFVPALLVVAAGTARPAPPHPVVAGYERFFPDKSDARGGALLLSELGCVKCHESTGKDFAPRTAPILDDVGSRVRTSWLRKYLADPHAVKPGTVMPHVLADDPDKADKVEALVHLLASTGGLRHERVQNKSLAAGKQHYERFGCVACHGTRKADGAEDKVISTQVPLGDLKAKYSVTSLAVFLQDPLHSRPGGRMPRLLDAKEAKEAANYLLQGLKVDAPGGKGSAQYAYYEGDFGKVPDFTKMKPKATGTSQGFDVGVSRRESNYALRFEAVLGIETEGQYTFELTSDDGSLLFIDDKLVVNNDGIHAPQTKGGKAKLTKGVHKVVIGFMQGGGGAELEARISGPGLGETDLGQLVAATEADLKKRPAPKAEGEEVLVVKPDLVKKGAGYFASLGCASCHQLKFEGKPIASTVKGPAMAKLSADKGCLSDKPAKNLPRYGLSEPQKKSMASAFNAEQAALTDEGKIANAMLTFNCYACHVRNKVGGPQDEINKTFLTTQQEMGDEGRLPPPIDGVGAKLNADYLKKILEQGVDDRPYMHVKMPGFGAANVGHLVTAFAETDKLPVTPEVKFTFATARIKSDGRKLVGNEMMACIKCHTFNGQKAEGVQGIDMAKMTQRVRRDWFHAYVIDPQKIRPGTRMPTSFPNGKSFFPEVLDGTPTQQIEALWVYLSDGTRARLPLGVGKAYIPLTPKDGAIIYRNFIAGAGPRGIAVGYPEKVHLAFDANELRIAMIWQGLFIDAARHWTDRGSGFEGPLGDNVVHLPTGPTFALLAKDDSAWPASARTAGQKFKGYKLTKDDRPTFLYAVGDVTVEDFPNTATIGKEQGLKRSFALSAAKAPEHFYLRAAVGKEVTEQKEGWYKVVQPDGATYRLKLTGKGKASLRKAGNNVELLFAPTFEDGKASVTQEIAW